MKIKQEMELLPWVHKSKARANGKAPLFIRITISGKSREVSVDSIAPENWDVKAKIVLRGEQGYREINNRIIEISGKLIEYYRTLCKHYGEGNVTTDMVKAAYNSNQVSQPERKDQQSPIGNLIANTPTFNYPYQQTLPGGQRDATELPYGTPSQPLPIDQLLAMQMQLPTIYAQLNGLPQQMASNMPVLQQQLVNNPIDALQAQLNAICLQFNQFISQAPSSIGAVDIEVPQNEVKQVNTEKPFTLIDGFNEYITRFEKLVEKKKRSDGTLRQWKSTKGKIIALLEAKFGISDIPYTNVMPDFGDVLYDYLTLEVDQPLAEPTAKKHIKKTKQILKIGVKKRIIAVNPIADFVCGGDQKEVPPLEIDQVYTIYQKDFGVERLNEVADAYVFQCFTGFAYQDLYRLTPENIVLVGKEREKWLIKDRGKTGVSEMVPILPIVDELIEKYKEHPKRLIKNQLIPVDSNTNYNGFLKEIAVICGINRVLKTHLARHTFADIMLNLGVPLEDVSKMLGHKSIRTTQRYCRVRKERISENMKSAKGKLFNKAGKLRIAD